MNKPKPLSDEQIRAHTVGAVQPLTGKVLIADYDPQWPEIFRHQSETIKQALGAAALQVEHTGSTSVPGLAAKPVIDILLVVENSAEEISYIPGLEGIGYVLRIREPDWHQHRMLMRSAPSVNLHVFSAGCPEIDRVLLFRDWLRDNAADRDLYARAKRGLAQRQWKHVQNYADAKTAIVLDILQRATEARRRT